MRIIRNKSPQFKRWLRELEGDRSTLRDEAREAAEVVISEVRDEGDRAVARSVRKFDRGSLRPNELLDEVSGAEKISTESSRAIDEVIERVERFHERQKVEGYEIESNDSILRHKVRPLERVGLYIPGGKAVHLTTLIMCAVPARLAGVKDIVVATPLAAAKSSEFRAVCSKLGIREIYRAGGPAAIAAMAYGTQSLKRVSKIVGPGNRYVSAAKAILAGTVGLDMTTSGGGELVVVIDETTDVERLVRDLLAQTERGEDNLTVCITRAAEVGRAVSDEVGRLKRQKKSGNQPRILDREGVVITAASDGDAVDLVNRLGPQRVSLQTRNASELVDSISCSGAIFVGGASMLVAGALGAGPNEVLPTRGTSRFFSPLGVYDFYKRSNVVELSAESLEEMAESSVLIAELESLDHHARAMRMVAARDD